MLCSSSARGRFFVLDLNAVGSFSEGYFSGSVMNFGDCLLLSLPKFGRFSSLDGVFTSDFSLWLTLSLTYCGESI